MSIRYRRTEGRKERDRQIHKGVSAIGTHPEARKKPRGAESEEMPGYGGEGDSEGRDACGMHISICEEILDF